MVVSTLLVFSDPYFCNKFPFWPPSLLSPGVCGLLSCHQKGSRSRNLDPFVLAALKTYVWSAELQGGFLK